MSNSPLFSSRKFFLGLLLIVNIVVSGALVASFLAQIIAPTTSTYIAFAGLFFPYLIGINLFFIIFWLIFKLKWALLPAICVLININNIDKYYQFRGQATPKTCVNCVKVMSYNVHLFGLYDTEDKKKREEKLSDFFAFIKDEQPDFLCFQEYFFDKTGKLKFPTTDSIKASLKIRNERNYYQYFPTNRGKEYYFGYAIFSKYRIIDKGQITSNDSANTTMGIYIDFKYKNDTLRLYNVHLASIRFDENDYETGRQLRNSDLNDPHLNVKAKRITEKISNAFNKRTVQAEALRQHIKMSPHPVIVCGDMNDTPISYTYNTVAKGLKDAFRESGESIGKTYAGSVFPNYRIDYILHDKRYNSFGYQTYPDFKESDHQPISAVISLISARP